MYWLEFPATTLPLHAQFQSYSWSSALAWLLCTGNHKMLWLYFKIQSILKSLYWIFVCYFVCFLYSPAEPHNPASIKSFPATQITNKANIFNTLFCQQGSFSVCVVVSNDTATDQTFVLVLSRKHFQTSPALASPSWPRSGKMATESLSRTPAPCLTCC